MRRVAILIALSLWTTGGQSIHARTTATQLASESRTKEWLTDVWDREETYWRLVAAGDVSAYLDLWHSDFRGWPCATEHTATKSTIADWIKEIRDEHIQFTYRLQREGASVVNGVVVVYYRTPLIYRYPDGHVVGENTTKKFTHTWIKDGDVWRIIGGMCGADAPR